MMKDYYQLLGVAKNATPTDIAKAYRIQALRHHPDINGGKGDRMRELNEAYATLSDPAQRMIYDLKVLPFNGFPGPASLSRWFNPHRRNHRSAMLMNRKAGLRHIPLLIEALAKGDPETCFAIKDLLVCYGSQAAAYLQAYLTHTKERVRYFVLLALNEMGCWPPERRLVGLLQDPSWKIRIEVIHALSASRGPRAILHLKQLMTDEVMSVRLSVIEALEDLGGALAAEVICAGLIDKEARVRKEAATALGHLGQVESIRHLRQILNDTNPYVCRAARQAIRRLRIQKKYYST